MFEQFLRSTDGLARYRNGPLAEERDRYLAYLAERGQSNCRLRTINIQLLAFAQRLQIQGSKQLTGADILAAAESWMKERTQRSSQPRALQIARTDFVSIAHKWLRFLDRLQEAQPRIPFGDLLEEFLRHLREERGLADASVLHRKRSLVRFLLWLSANGGSIATVSPKEITEYFSAHGACSWKRETVKSYADSIRSFFRYAEQRFWCVPGIAATVEGPRIYYCEQLPQAPAWKDVQRLIGNASDDHPTQIRNRAAILLLAVYGFRIGEVCNLTLDDICWETELIRVRRSKQRKVQDYPLTAEVGEAILKYLKEIRPRTNHRKLFLTLRMPYRPILAYSLGARIANLVRQLGVQLPHYGPHILRHACATNLISNGFSLKEIGDHLGHRSARATQIYTKVDFPSLRQVARQDLSDLIGYAETRQRETEVTVSEERLAALREVAYLNLGGVL